MADDGRVSPSTWATIHIMRQHDYSCWLFEDAENWNKPVGSDAYRRVCQQYHSSKETILDIVERSDPGLDSLADFWSETDFLQFPQDISECYIMLGKMCALYTLHRLDFESLRFHVHRKPLLNHVWALQSAQVREWQARLARAQEAGSADDDEGMDDTMEEEIFNDDFLTGPEDDGIDTGRSVPEDGFHYLGKLMCMFYMYIMPTNAERRRDYVAQEQYM